MGWGCPSGVGAMAWPGKGLEAKRISPAHLCLSAGPAPTQRQGQHLLSSASDSEGFLRVQKPTLHPPDTYTATEVSGLEVKESPLPPGGCDRSGALEEEVVRRSWGEGGKRTKALLLHPLAFLPPPGKPLPLPSLSSRLTTFPETSKGDPES